MSIIVFNFSKNSIISAVDNLLYSKIETIINLIEFEHNRIELELEEFNFGQYAKKYSGHYYKVIIKGYKTFSSKSLGDNSFDLTNGTLVSKGNYENDKIYLSRGPNNEVIRVLEKRTSFMGYAIRVLCAEDISENLLIIEKIKILITYMFFILNLIFGLGIFLITRFSLQPIESFSHKVKNINHQNLNEKIELDKSVSEIKELTLEFNNMLERIKKAFEVEKFIISEASHKLKTPIAVIKSYCDIVLQKDREKKEYIETIEAIKNNSNKITNIINGITSLTNLESGNMQIYSKKDISLNKCLSNALELSKHLADKKNIVVKTKLSANTNYFGDEDKLTEAFFNIIENAIKYNKNKGSIFITLEKNKESILVSIEDTGLGIEEKNLTKIFDRFYREEHIKSIEGSGLGLNISKSIIEAHNGNISVKSILGKGTTFFITLNT